MPLYQRVMETSWNPLMTFVVVALFVLALFLDNIRVRFGRIAFSRIEKLALFNIVTIGTLVAVVSLFITSSLGLWSYPLSESTGILEIDIYELQTFIAFLPLAFYILVIMWGKRIKSNQ